MRSLWMQVIGVISLSGQMSLRGARLGTRAVVVAMVAREDHLVLGWGIGRGVVVVVAAR